MAQAARAVSVPRDVESDSALGRSPWTCPFCALHCDRFAIELGESLELVGSDCPQARAGLARFSGKPSTATPLIDGKCASMEQALDAASTLLRQARQPLIAGLATDVAGSRAAFRLAQATGAILDHAHGMALMSTVRAIQDRGVYATTLAEIRNRADILVCIATTPSQRYPEFYRRCGVGEATWPDAPARRLVFVGTPVDAAAASLQHVSVESLELQGDRYTTIATLSALVAGRGIRENATALERLAARLRDARYAVFVWEPAQWDEHGALAAESIHAIVSTLNRTTRAAVLALSGSDGAYTANQVTTWLGGLPLRTALHAQGPMHDPLRYATDTLLRGRASDALVWISSFGPRPAVPSASARSVILGHPAAASDASAPGTIFIPVSTPGIGSAAHMFRLDGGVALPLRAIYEDTLPTVAHTLDEITRRVRPRAVRSTSPA